MPPIEAATVVVAPTAAPLAPVVADPYAHLDDTPEVAVNWESLSTGKPGMDDGGVGDDPPPEAPAPAAPTPPAAAPAAPVVPPVAPASPAPAAPVVPPVVAPVVPPVPVAPAAPVVPPAPVKTNEQLAAEAQARRQQQEQTLTAHYAKELTEEDKQELLVSPEKAIPRLMAKVALDTLAVASEVQLQQIQQAVPHALNQRQESTRVEQEFYGANQDIAAAIVAQPQLQTVVVQMASAARALMPKASMQDVMQKAAELARTAIGLPPQAAATPGQPAAPAAAPAAPMTPARPFKPAAAGAAPAAPNTPAAPNPWLELSQDEV